MAWTPPWHFPTTNSAGSAAPPSNQTDCTLGAVPTPKAAVSAGPSASSSADGRFIASNPRVGENRATTEAWVPPQSMM